MSPPPSDSLSDLGVIALGVPPSRIERRVSEMVGYQHDVRRLLTQPRPRRVTQRVNPLKPYLRPAAETPHMLIHRLARTTGESTPHAVLHSRASSPFSSPLYRRGTTLARLSI